MQGRTADSQKENIENLKIEILEFEIVGEFLEEIKKEFGEKDKESRKVMKLKKIKQDQQTMNKESDKRQQI